MIALSIIVPVYNAARFILDFAAYITDHLNTNIEVVFINDGSTDNSWELLQQVSKTLPNKQILNKTNGGAASARNLGIQHAQGDYLLFVDIDDTFELPLIAEKIKWVREQELDLFVYRYNYIKQDGSVNNLTSKHPVTYHKVDTGLFFLQQGYQPSSICALLLNTSCIL
jgi:glycosyltransferase involved in cell wall biosynthesis